MVYAQNATEQAQTATEQTENMTSGQVSALSDPRDRLGVAGGGGEQVKMPGAPW
ncbi:MAG: hypothetical protein WBX01_16685 [Nitrososphaeraceae archaeon]